MKGDKIEWSTGPTRWMVGDVQSISVPFTWNLPDLRREFMQRDFLLSKVRVGGPALKLMPDYFADMPWIEVGDDEPGVLQRMNSMATRTTVGCIRRCGFCAVPKTEGCFIELEDWPDLPVICDNNLLAASQPHFDKVCDRLERHSWCDFNQGLDARILTDYHAERLGRLKGAIIRLALDHSGTTGLWYKAFETLRKHGVAKNRIRTYVLCGFKSGVIDAWERCETAQKEGTLALPQWYHPLDALEYGKVLPCHEEYGWTRNDMLRIMGYYYQHRGTKPVLTRVV